MLCEVHFHLATFIYLIGDGHTRCNGDSATFWNSKWLIIPCSFFYSCNHQMETALRSFKVRILIFLPMLVKRSKLLLFSLAFLRVCIFEISKKRQIRHLRFNLWYACFHVLWKLRIYEEPTFGVILQPNTTQLQRQRCVDQLHPTLYTQVDWHAIPFIFHNVWHYPQRALQSVTFQNASYVVCHINLLIVYYLLTPISLARSIMTWMEFSGWGTVNAGTAGFSIPALFQAILSKVLPSMFMWSMPRLATPHTTGVLHNKTKQNITYITLRICVYACTLQIIKLIFCALSSLFVN